MLSNFRVAEILMAHLTGCVPAFCFFFQRRFVHTREYFICVSYYGIVKMELTQ